ncbi:DUF2975 domain-containing protein [Rugamonas sp. CCM 8940]|uniref:DUF2975 domain-containing protein n=1 Tax=Rugamonas sp. CCM 8940 TaxID=2765359 RepID=UPI0018F47587|nr:DUF2975 domain-containing protein [Rugamonas sp. CCM 8940]MBJ7308975.1 DUF2975 domain-containing protein [Rugamonas sp. CCM 8940]
MKTIRPIRCLLWLCCAVVAGFYVLSWSGDLPHWRFLYIEISPNGMSRAQMLALTPGQRLLSAALGLPAVLTLLYGLWRLDRLLLNFRRLALFSAASACHLRAFAAAVPLATLLSIVELPVRALALRAAGAAVPAPTMGFSSEQLTLVLVCALFYLVTGLMDEGRRLAEENEGFV